MTGPIIFASLSLVTVSILIITTLTIFNSNYEANLSNILYSQAFRNYLVATVFINIPLIISFLNNVNFCNLNLSAVKNIRHSYYFHSIVITITSIILLYIEKSNSKAVPCLLSVQNVLTIFNILNCIMALERNIFWSKS
jgi:hypothetical protein